MPGTLSDWLTSLSPEIPFELETGPVWDVGAFDPYTLEQRDYRGPEPAAVMLIVLKNAGRTAANDITGTIATSAEYMRILDFPGLDAEKVSQPDDNGNHTAELGTISELLPGRSDAFKIGITLGPEAQSSEGHWSLKYDFITPSGHGVSGTWPLGREASDNPEDQ